MSVKFLNMVWECPSILDKNELLVLLAIADWSNDNGEAYPSLSQLATKCRMSRKGITNILARVRDKFIAWEDNQGGRNVRNQYTLLKDALNGEPHSPFKDDDTVNPVHRLLDRNSNPGSPFEQAETVNPVPLNSEPRSLAINHHKPSLISTTTTEPPVSPFSEFQFDFLNETDKTYLPTILDRLKEYRPQDVCELITREWRRRSGSTSAILALSEKYSHEVFTSAVIIAGDSQNPNLKFLSSILTRLERQKQENVNGTTSQSSASDQVSRAVHDPNARTGSALSQGIRKGARASGGRPKRPGESSRAEWLRDAGFTEEEIYGSTQGPASAGLIPPHPTSDEG